MKKQSPTAIAKNPDSTPEQLKTVYESTRDNLHLYRRINRLLASNPNTPAELLEEILEELVIDEDKITKANALSNPNIPKDTLAHLLPDLDKRNVLVGNYPKYLDLSRCNHKTPISQFYSEDDYKWDKEQGGYPMPDIHLFGNDTVEEICLSAEIWYEYVIVENLPRLKKLYVGSACKKYPADYRLPRWLVCRNLPELKEIVVGEDVSWLRLEDMKELSVVDASCSSQLDYFYIKNCPAIKKIDIENCVKLRNIDGLSKDIQDVLGVTGHIKVLQERSRCDGSLYWPMTFTDVGLVLSNINHAIMLAGRKGLWPKFVKPNYGELSFMDKNYSYGFSFRLLRPNESVFRGGAGGGLDYETIMPSYGDEGPLSDFRIGDSGQEGCLYEILHHIRMLGIDIPGRQSHVESQVDCFPSVEEVLSFLNQLLDEERRNRSSLKKPD